MKPIETLIAVFLIGVGASMLPFLLAEVIYKRIKPKNTPIDPAHPLSALCSCHAGPGQSNKYYHARTCQYRRKLEVDN